MPSSRDFAHCLNRLRFWVSRSLRSVCPSSRFKTIAASFCALKGDVAENEDGRAPQSTWRKHGERANRGHIRETCAFAALAS